MVTAKVLQHISHVQGSSKTVTVRFLLCSPLLGDAEMADIKEYTLPSKMTEQGEKEAAWAVVRERAIAEDGAFTGVKPIWEPVQDD